MAKAAEPGEGGVINKPSGNSGQHPGTSAGALTGLEKEEERLSLLIEAVQTMLTAQAAATNTFLATIAKLHAPKRRAPKRDA